MAISDYDAIKITMESVSILGTIAISWIALTIRSVVMTIKLDQAKNKEELLLQQNKNKEDLVNLQTSTKEKLTEKIQEHKLALSVHEVLDNERFRSMQATLQDIAVDIKDIMKSSKNGSAAH